MSMFCYSHCRRGAALWPPASCYVMWLKSDSANKCLRATKHTKSATIKYYVNHRNATAKLCGAATKKKTSAARLEMCQNVAASIEHTKIVLCGMAMANVDKEPLQTRDAGHLPRKRQALH